MPVYDYQCSDCGKIYDVYHKSKEIIEDVICPSCNSASYKKLMSVSGISIGGSSSGSHDASCGGSCCRSCPLER